MQACSADKDLERYGTMGPCGEKDVGKNDQGRAPRHESYVFSSCPEPDNTKADIQQHGK